MTEAGWTRERPNKPGAYWFRGNQWGTQMLVLVKGRKNVLEVNCQGDTNLDNYQGEFLGPITPDSYQQGRVEGLREAHSFALDAGAFYTAAKIGSLIDKAQAAQDEKGVGDGNTKG